MLVTLLIIVLCVITPFARADREPPHSVKPVLHSGLRYEAPKWTAGNKKMKQNGGYVRVVNTRDGLPICTKQIYETKYDKNLEADVQDNFIVSLSIKGDALVVASEKLPPTKIEFAGFCD